MTFIKRLNMIATELIILFIIIVIIGLVLKTPIIKGIIGEKMYTQF